MSVAHDADMFQLHFVGSAVIFITNIVYWHYLYSYDVLKVLMLISGMLASNCWRWDI